MQFPTTLAFHLLTALGLPSALVGQAAGPTFSAWQAELPRQDRAGSHWVAMADTTLTQAPVPGASRSHTGTGLLVGSLVGVAATTVFLIGFCSDSDTVCGADEIGRALLIFGGSGAALGAIIGFLIRTER